MRMKFEKKMRMGTDLLAYCRTRGAKNFKLEINIDDEKHHTRIVAKADPVIVSEEELKRARKFLNAPRAYDIESKYWGLSGESESYSELMLVGMMCDEAEVELVGDELTITLLRKIG